MDNIISYLSNEYGVSGKEILQMAKIILLSNGVTEDNFDIILETAVSNFSSSKFLDNQNKLVKKLPSNDMKNILHITILSDRMVDFVFDAELEHQFFDDTEEKIASITDSVEYALNLEIYNNRITDYEMIKTI